MTVASIAASYALAIEERYANRSPSVLFDIGALGAIGVALLCVFLVGYYDRLAYWLIAIVALIAIAYVATRHRATRSSNARESRLATLRLLDSP